MAVYTDVAPEELESFLATYDIGRLRAFKGIAEGVENSNYLLQTEAGSFILTLYEKRVNPDDLPFFIDLMEHLASRGIDCPQPVKNRTGTALGTLAGRPALIATFLVGTSVRRPTAAHCAALGTALAGLHKAGADFTARRRVNALSVPGWRPLFDQAKARADTVAPGLADLIADELGVLEPNWPAGLPAGIIHADLFPDNVFFIDGRLSGLIDFYFACNDLLAYDIAICLNAWCFEADGAYNLTKGRALLAAYGAERALTPAEIDALPLLCRGAALRFLLTRLVDWLNVPLGALVRPHDPRDYLRRLRFHRSVESVRDYGIGA
ncbi:homoserine kinase [Ancylobacter pratisalsi]|uniref:Homoserine kinase n=1 Tax=Ancylobacter pratisalsi TaxID=1745854 RepID=A0A6P1YJ49_9HYPH|nr:homoserine kinase [Ancylobacter pratisalsi]QIB33407.1 homoserine kinase [Ancylobacter pratisalsi]